MSGPPPRHRPKGTGLSYHSSAYWNTRFATDPRETHGFEWLSSSSSLVDLIPPSLLLRDPPPRILHIGVGTSRLSLDIVRWLRERRPEDWRARAQQIFNVDFSEEGIEFQRRADAGFCQEVGEEGGEGLMEYYVLDLLDWEQVSDVLGAKAFDVVLDKSTTDSISTGADVPFTTVLRTTSTHHPSLLRLASQHSATDTGIATTQVLGIHLAALVRPHALWLCHSYSSTRWDDVITDSWPWRQVQSTPIAVQGSDPNAPQIHHWIYTLQRT